MVIASKKVCHIVLIGGQPRPDLALAAARLRLELLQRHALDIPAARDRYHRPDNYIF